MRNKKVRTLSLKKLLKKKSSGIAIIETVFVFPLFVLLVFLVLEFQQFGQVRSAVSSLASMMAHDFSISGSMRTFPKCVQKFAHIIKPARVRYYVHLYTDLNHITPHEAYYDENGNGQHESSEPYADMNFSRRFDFNPSQRVIFAGSKDVNENFFQKYPDVKAGLVVVVYKFNFVTWLIQKSFSRVALKNTDGDLPIIGTGLIIRHVR